jgi:hypothetical protein
MRTLSTSLVLPAPLLPALLAALLSPLLSPLARAQTPPNLLGVTLNTTSVWEGDHATCTPISLCPTGQPSTGQFLWQGGSAWDSQSLTAWISNGNLVGRYSTSSCTAVCPPVVCPRTPGSDVCGLDLYDSANELWVIDSVGGITRCSNACPPVLINTTFITPALISHIPTGISIDELRGLVFFSATDFGSPQGNGRIYVAPLSSPGSWFQFTQVVDCITTASHRITGLAVDAGNSALYWTDGRNTYKTTYTYSGTPTPGSVVITPQSCCIGLAVGPDPLIDLSIRWGGPTSSGLPCANGTCPSCPMLHTLRTAPLLGTTLQLGLDQAPLGVPSWCLLNFGSCTTGTTFGPLCGPVLTPLTASLATLGINVTSSSGPPCSGTTTFLLFLPPIPALAGTPLASQCVALCPPTGTTMSNCLSWVLQ